MKHFKRRLIPQMIERLTLRNDQGVLLSQISYLTSNAPEDIIMKEIFFSCTRDPLRDTKYDGIYSGALNTDKSRIDLKKHCIVKLKKDNLDEENYRKLRMDFINECNKIINSLIKILKKNTNYFQISEQDSYLVSFLLSILAITKVKDIANQELDENFLNSFVNSDFNEMNPAKRGHTLAITTIELKENTTYEKFFSNHGLDVSEWEPISDGKCIINSDTLITKKKGYSIIKCKNIKDDDLEFSFRIMCGENIREQKLIYFLDQIRNIVAHGLFVLDQGETRKLACRKVLIKTNNQLNVAYGGGNYFIMEYFPYLATNLYSEDNYELVQNIKYFMEMQTPGKKVFIGNKPSFEKFLLLMKFYVNFIYNMDYSDKKEFDYSILLKNKKIDSFQFFNYLRTSIMHGWYKEDLVNGKEGLSLWCLDKEDREKKVFETFLSFKQIKLICDNKEKLFNGDLKF